MVVDFSDIKNIAKTWIDDALDHGYMFQSTDPIGETAKQQWLKVTEVDFPPTAEHISRYVFEKLEELYRTKFGSTISLYSIKLRETPTSYVIYQTQKN